MKRFLLVISLLVALAPEAEAAVLRTVAEVRELYGDSRILFVSVPVPPDALLNFRGVQWYNFTGTFCHMSVYEGETVFRVDCLGMPLRYIDAKKHPFGQPIAVWP